MAKVTALDDEVRDYLDQAPAAALRCRRWMHAWEPRHEGFMITGSGADERWSTEAECLRCGTVAVDWFEPWTMNRLGPRQYTYAEGYLTQNGVQVSRQEVRQWIAEQQMGTVKAMRRQSRTTRKAA